MVAAVERQPKESVIVLGFGLGYHVERLLEEIEQDANVLVIEARPAHLAAALRARDLTGLFADPRFSMLFDDDGRKSYKAFMVEFTNFLFRGLRFLEHSPSVSLSPEVYRKIRDELTQGIHGMTLMARTRLKDSERYMKNWMRNVPLHALNGDLSLLMNVWRGLPGIVVSGGPSLYRNIDRLRDARKKAVLIATDITLRPLMDRGIRPDIVMTLDPHALTRRFFDGFDPAGVQPVACTLANQEAVELMGDRTLFVADPATVWVMTHVKHASRFVLDGTNIGHYCFRAAQFLGLDPIALVGQDFAFTNHVTHLPGTAYHAELQPMRNRFSTLEMFELTDILSRKKDLVQVEDIHGNMIFTDKVFAFYLRSMEDAICDIKVRIVDATEGGARIKGAEILTLAEFLADLPDRPPEPDVLWKPDPDRLRSFFEFMEGIEAQLDGLRREACRESRAFKRVLSAIANKGDVDRRVRKIRGVNEAMREYDDARRLLHTLFTNDPALLQDWGGVREFNTAEELEAHVEKDRRYCEIVIEAIDKTRPHIEQMLDHCRALLKENGG
jgi:hypothetical protein